MNPIEEKALRIYVEKLEKQNEQMRLLSTKIGFYQEYFKELKTAKTNKEAFENVNDRYFELFGSYRYSDFNTFKRMTNYYNNQKSKK
jgi:hypothetical protein